MKYTPKEISELLKERQNQAHYIEWMVRRAVHEAVKAEREACAAIAEEPYELTSAEASRIAAAIRARSLK